MLPRRLLRIVVAATTLAPPLGAVAHAAVSGSVTTAPYAPAPAMGIPMMVVLGVMLAGGGGYLLRRTRSGEIAKVGVVAGLTAMVGLTYATNGGTTITIKDAQCGMQAVNPFDPSELWMLQSSCPNAIQILKIDVDCVDPPPPTAACYEGQILTTGQSCALPVCVG